MLNPERASEKESERMREPPRSAQQYLLHKQKLREKRRQRELHALVLGAIVGVTCVFLIALTAILLQH